VEIVLHDEGKVISNRIQGQVLRRLILRGKALPNLAENVVYLIDILEQGLSVAVEIKPSPYPVEQAATELFFQICQALAQRRLGNVQLASAMALK